MLLDYTIFTGGEKTDMKAKYWQLGIASLIMAVVLWAPLGVQADIEELQDPGLVKALSIVDPYVLEQIDQNGMADFFIVLKDQADLRGVKMLRNKKDKGRFVFEQLSETAGRSQVAILEELESVRAAYQSYHIQNMILVRGGEMDLLMDMTTRSDVAAIRGNRPFEFENFQPEAYPDNMPGRTPEWNLAHIGITDIWAEGVTGEGIVVANLDTGVDWDHPALKNHYRGWNGSTADHNYNWHDASNACSPPNIPCDTGNHGTHTMGTMVGEDPSGTNQVGGAPGAEWIACGPLTDDASFHECFEWFLAPYAYGDTPAQGDPSKAPDVVNNSWGWPIGGGDYQYAPDLDALQSAGVFMEFSAGNEGDSCETLRSPGDYPQVLTTGASDVQDRIVSTSWTYWGSSRGPAAGGIPGAPDFIKPEIVAPGYDIRSCVPGTGYEGGWGGTSMAGPHTCAVVALMWSAAPNLIGDIEATRQIILDTAYTSMGSAGYWNQTCEGINAAVTIPNHVWGWGLIDAYAAYQALVGIYLDKDAYQPNDTIGIMVRDSGSSGSIQVQIQSDTESVWEDVTLTEGLPGEFNGSITCSTTAPVHGDNILSVTDGDTITCHSVALDSSDTAGVDGSAPVISNITVDAVADTWATITWQTNEPSKSIVNYGMGTPDMTEQSDDMVTSHSLTITGLDMCTTYVFDVAAEDAAANTALDNNGGMHYSFTTFERFIFLEANMDTNPGWTTQSEWAFGQPTGGGGEYGEPDPTSGYTGNNVYGVNLNGDYPNSMGSTLYLTTPSMDCSGTDLVEFSFWCWLGVEQDVYDHANIDVSNNGGSSWQNIWINTSTLDGGSWEFWEFDISSIAAGYSDVQIRWGIGPTDTAWRFCGWNIDDVTVSFVGPCEQTCTNNGDANLDGEVTSGDAQMTFQIALGAYSPTPDEECGADCNGDGIVTSGDAQGVFITALGAGSCADPMTKSSTTDTVIQTKPLQQTRNRVMLEEFVMDHSGMQAVHVVIDHPETAMDAVTLTLDYNANALKFSHFRPSNAVNWVDADAYETTPGHLTLGAYTPGIDAEEAILPATGTVLGTLLFNVTGNGGSELSIARLMDDLKGFAIN